MPPPPPSRYYSWGRAHAFQACVLTPPFVVERPSVQIGPVTLNHRLLIQVPLSPAGATFLTKSARRTAVRDPREAPAYTVAEAAHYVRLPVATLRTWVAGREYPTRTGARTFPPLVRLADSSAGLLSFSNLIEAHVLRALRAEHAVSIRDVRTAVRYAEKELGIERLLLNKELRTSGGELFLARYGELLSLSRSGQIAMKRLLEAHLARVEWDRWKFPVRLYPFLRAEASDDARPIAIDPSIQFGRPIVLRRGISTRIIAERIDAGESLTELAEDYGLEIHEIEEAIVYERAA